MTEARKSKGAGKGAAAVAALTIAVAAWFVAPWEDPPGGPALTGYADIVGVSTACTGHTGPGVEVGKRYTPEQCKAWLDSDLGIAARGVDACIARPMPANVWAAFTSLAFNVGVPTFCRSSVARKFNAGDTAGACQAIGLYVYAGGKRVPGLVSRRNAEIELCGGVPVQP